MNEVIKERLVGIVVLVLMMVVVMPWLLDHGVIESAQSSGATRPSREAQRLRAAKSPSISLHTDKQSRMQTNRAVAQKSTVHHTVRQHRPLVFHQQTKAEVPQAILDAQAKKVALASGHAWYAQIGSFANKANAKKMMSSLAIKHIPCRMQRHATHGGRVYRVYLGPFLNRKQADDRARPWAHNHAPLVINTKG